MATVLAVAALAVAAGPAAADPPNLTFTNTDFGSDVSTGPGGAQINVTITNTGGTAAYIYYFSEDSSVQNISASGANVTLENIGGDAPGRCYQTNVLNPNDSCYVSVRWTPSTPTSLIGGKLTVPYLAQGDASWQSIDATLSGTAPPRGVLTGLENISFSTQMAGAGSQEQEVTLSNSGTGDVNVNSVSLFQGSDPLSSDAGVTLEPASSNDCENAATMAIGEQCNIKVKWDPLQPMTLIGLSAEVHVVYNDSIADQTFTIRLAGMADSPLSVTGTAYGSEVVVQAGGDLQTTITNQGNAAVQINTASITASTGITVGTTSCDSTPLQSGDSCTVASTWTPTATGPLTDGAITVPYEFTGGPIADEVITVTGDAIQGGPLEATTSDGFAFGDSVHTGDVSTRPVVFRNVGLAGITIDSVVFSETRDDLELIGTVDECATNFVVAWSSNCNLDMQWSPQADTELPSGLHVTITYHDASGIPQSVDAPISGTSTTPAPPTIISNKDFGSAQAGKAASLDVVINNPFPVDVYLAEVAVTGQGVATDTGGTCVIGALVPRNSSCTMRVRWVPAEPGPLTGSKLTVVFSANLSSTNPDDFVTFEADLSGNAIPADPDVLPDSGKKHIQCVKPPKRVPYRGTVKLLSAHCASHNGPHVRARVKSSLGGPAMGNSRGDVRFWRVIIKKNGSVWLRNYGVHHKLRVKYTAPATDAFYKFKLVKKYQV